MFYPAETAAGTNNIVGPFKQATFQNRQLTGDLPNLEIQLISREHESEKGCNTVDVGDHISCYLIEIECII